MKSFVDTAEISEIKELNDGNSGGFHHDGQPLYE